MRMKSFLAASLPDALEMARAELGPEAIILSSQKVPGGVELRAAVEQPWLAKRPAIDDGHTAPDLVSDATNKGNPDEPIWGGPAQIAEIARQHFAKRRDGQPSPNRTGTHQEAPQVANRTMVDPPSIGGSLEHFAMKWKPVNRNKMRLNKEIEHGFDSIKTQTALAEVIANFRASTQNQPTAAQWQILADWLAGQIHLEPLSLPPQRSILVVGEAGAGRTSALGQFALQSEIAGADVDLLAYEPDPMGGAERLAAIAKRPSEDVMAANNPASLLRLIARQRLERRLTLIDGPNVNFSEAQPFAQAQEFTQASDADLVCVVSAQNHVEDLTATLDKIENSAVGSIILTRLDLTQQHIKIFAAFFRRELRLAQLGAGLVATQGLVPASGLAIARLLAGDAAGFARRGQERNEAYNASGESTDRKSQQSA